MYRKGKILSCCLVAYLKYSILNNAPRLDTLLSILFPKLLVLCYSTLTSYSLRDPLWHFSLATKPANHCRISVREVRVPYHTGPAPSWSEVFTPRTLSSPSRSTRQKKPLLAPIQSWASDFATLSSDLVTLPSDLGTQTRFSALFDRI